MFGGFCRCSHRCHFEVWNDCVAAAARIKFAGVFVDVDDGKMFLAFARMMSFRSIEPGEANKAI